MKGSEVPRAEWVRFDGEHFRVSQQMLIRPNALKGLVVGGGKVALAAGAAFWWSRSWGVTWFCAAMAARGHHVVAVTIMSAAYLVGGKKWTAALNPIVGFFLPGICTATNEALRGVGEELMKSMKGVVLDVGAGSGAFVRSSVERGGAVARYIALEPNVRCHAAIRKTFAEEVGKAVARGAAAETLPRLELVGGSLSELAATFGPASVDWIILGNVICEMKEPAQQLRLLDSLLKPGGRVFFSEHVRDPQPQP